jgi:hypothetical protein
LTIKSEKYNRSQASQSNKFAKEKFQKTGTPLQPSTNNKNRLGTKITMLNEVEILAKLSNYNDANQNILRYYASWEEDSTLFIKTEYCMNTLDKL